MISNVIHPFAYNMSRLVLFFTFQIWFFYIANGKYIYEEVAMFCESNGLKYVNIFTTSESPSIKTEAKEALETLNEYHIRTRSFENELSRENLDFELDSVLLISDIEILSDPSLFKIHLEELGLHKIRRSALVFHEPLNELNITLLHNSLQNLLDKDAFFFIFYQDMTGSLFKKQAISLNNITKTFIKDISFNNLNISEDNFNLEGEQLLSKTLSWAPYFIIENCDESGRNCDLSGFLADYMDAMGRILNFTWTSHAPADGSWGVRPISGPFNKSGVWGGAMGSIVNGEYHISLSQWVWNIERRGLFDFICTSSNRVALALTPQPPEIDPGLFIRPFRDDAWNGIAVVCVIMVVCLMVPFSLMKNYEQTESVNISVFSVWMFFVLINAYYGGALTMFFTSEITIPFNSIEDVMREYPDWKLKMMNGNDVHFQYKALQGDTLYSEFWDRVTNLPEETVFHTLEEGLDLLKNERAVIHTFVGMLKGYFQANPFRNQRVKVFAFGRAEYYSVIVPSNSPLKPFLQRASNILTEAGTNDYLIKEWEGKEIPSGGQVEVTFLSIGQTVLVFMMIFGLLGISIIVLGCEIGFKSMKKDTYLSTDSEKEWKPWNMEQKTNKKLKIFKSIRFKKQPYKE